ncbi:ERV/ALR sulfhydryl oxidase domain-containing protein [Emericellopsis atlantica]|uniref:Sulfhydryl oxidase n=1 Tax=Emericellopsis atlantica TaxID=2614577 RepID=A0A9P8CQJ2_9HYPO|nr:ERV/ALR sulfhydryl oxidase domain-containing protein [Emericellopsis atlantica]KAG9253801.1 ERV/ALR sulfhydryl oxidase domain-containing protein [Emericellopsis atlantica]
MARRSNLALTVVLALVVFFSISYLFSSSPSSGYAGYNRDPNYVPSQMQAEPLKAEPLKSEPLESEPLKTVPEAVDQPSFAVDMEALPAGILEGESIAPKLENATLKAELGRATWKFLHTMAARFPENPTPSDRTALETFIHLFGRLYPCGDCARHFRQLLAEYPPQTSSRNAAAGWLCFAHNLVNERLEKEIFDCNNIGDFYDCGCGEEGKEGAKSEEGQTPEEPQENTELKLEKKS